MRYLLGTLVAIAAALLLVLLWRMEPSELPLEQARAPSPAQPATDSHAAESKDRIHTLNERVRFLEAELARAEQVRRAAGERPEDGEPAPAVNPEALTMGPRYYLDQYVLSFRDTDSGSEFFRLGVEAFAPQLVDPITGLVRSPSAHSVLRANLTAILGTTRLSGNGRVLALLLWVLRADSSPELMTAALEALGRLDDPAAVAHLERMVWTLPGGDLKLLCLRVMVQLAGPESNGLIRRLLAVAPDDETGAFLLRFLDPADPDGALPAFELAATMDVGLRLAAAERIAEFRSEQVLAFIEHWIRVESDETVRNVLGAAVRRLAAVPAWSALQAIGPPDATPGRDDPNAWASARGDMGAQWLELTYDPPLVAHTARIFEVNVPGAVTKLIAVSSSGAKHTVWEGTDPTGAPGVFTVSLGPAPFPLQRLRIVLDTDRGKGWNEIDAVELIGPAARAWASGARASSSYADR